MCQPLLDAAIGHWLAEIHRCDEKFSATFATTDSIAAVVVLQKKDILLNYEDTLLMSVTVTPGKINFVDKAFETLPADKIPTQFFWNRIAPTSTVLAKERKPGDHPRRIWLIHPGKKIAA